MCGINGIFAYHYAANPIDRGEIARTRDHMVARGPDGEGEWISDGGRAAFGHRRLAIIDLSEDGAQPMASVDGRFIVTFNGEIYNYRELRLELEGQGCAFKSQSDTEVLLHLYARRGADMVHDLRGMFALAIWDDLKGELFLARDPYGIKPLYYSDDGWTFRFASQVKALLAGGAVAREPDPAGEVGFFLFGYVPDPFTLYRSISALPAGTTMLVNRGGAQAPRRYHSVAQVYCDAEAGAGPALPLAEARAAFREAVLSSVRGHLAADVPVGLFLSAGIDSSALLGLMRDAGHEDVQAVTLSFTEFSGKAEDEAPLAAEVAAAYGARHTIRRVDRQEFEADLPRIFAAMDQPSIDGINTWFVCKAAREVGLKVAFSGVGGDELLGGYLSFTHVPRLVRLMWAHSRIPGLGLMARLLGRPLVAAMGLSPKAAGAVEYGGTYPGSYLLKRGLFMPWELGPLLPAQTIRAGMARLAPLILLQRELTPTPADPHARVAALESGIYMRSCLLRDADWAGMAHSIEVRAPLVDAELLKQVAALRASNGAVASKAALFAAPVAPIPAEIGSRAKTGFTTPVHSWQRPFGVERVSSARPSAGTPWARAWAVSVMKEFRGA